MAAGLHSPRSRPSRRPARALLAALLPWLAAAAFAQQAPRAVLVDPVQDAGVVRRGERVPFRFAVRNTGTAALALYDAEAACGCTVPSYPASIAAGGEGHVEVELDTSSLSGALAKSVKLRTNDPANPELVLTLKAEVRILVEARPGYLRFRHTLGEPAPAVAVDVWSPSRPRLEVLGVASPLPFLRARVREAAPADDGLRHWTVEFTLAADAPPGGAGGEVVVRTDHPRQPELRLPVSVHVQPVVEAVPASLELGILEPGAGGRWVLELRNHAADEVELSALSSDVAGLRLSLTPVDDQQGRLWDLEAELAGDEWSAGQEIRGELRLATSHAAQPAVIIPVHGRVAAAPAGEPVAGSN